MDRKSQERLRKLVSQSNVVIFHSLPPPLASALATAPSDVLKVWSGWGGDYYGTIVDSDHGLLGDETRRLVNGALRPTYWAGRYLYGFRWNPEMKAAAASTDIFSAPIPQDLRVFKNRFPKFKGRYHQLNYASVEDSLSVGARGSVGRNILVGNSAAPTNNHIEVFRAISNLDLTGRRVVVPLSYGNQYHADLVQEMGDAILGEAFLPVRNYLKLSDYLEILSSCQIAIFGANRQAALGNVLSAIWQGSQLVFSKASPFLEYFRDYGIQVTTLEGLADEGLPDSFLPADQISARSEFLERNWSRRAVVENARSLLRID